MKRVYLVQHAKAFDKDENQERPLTPEGISDIEKITKFLSQTGIEIDTIYHSGKTRAEQTAAVISRNLKDGFENQNKDNLGPVDDVTIIGDEIKEGEDTNCYVGHLPYMERIAAYLLTGDEKGKIIEFNNGGVVCLEDQDEGFFVNWVLTPEIIP